MFCRDPWSVPSRLHSLQRDIFREPCRGAGQRFLSALVISVFYFCTRGLIVAPAAAGAGGSPG